MRDKPQRPPITVAVVEDHPEFRDALCQALSASVEFRILAVCKDLPAGQSLLEHKCPDVLLVDLGLPSGSGLKLIRLAQTYWPGRCTSAVLTVTGNEEHLLTAVAAGAKGYLFKSDQPVDWVRTVRTLSRGQSPLHAALAHSFLQRSRTVPADEEHTPSTEAAWCPVELDIQTHALLLHVAAGYTGAEAAARLNLHPEEAGLRIRSVYDRLLQPGPCLSPRELELLRLLNKGFAFKKCAELMGVGESTTKTQAARAYEKLGASNLQMALYEARQAGLIT